MSDAIFFSLPLKCSGKNLKTQMYFTFNRQHRMDQSAENPESDPLSDTNLNVVEHRIMLI